MIPIIYVKLMLINMIFEIISIEKLSQAHYPGLYNTLHIKMKG